jgi:tetratricopeptide (TPR) repeat protein
VTRSWGGVARRGARTIDLDHGPGDATTVWRQAVARAHGDEAWEPERWIVDDEPESEPTRKAGRAEAPAPPAGARRAAPKGRPSPPQPRRAGANRGADTSDAKQRAGSTRRRLPPAVAAELDEATGARYATAMADRLATAARAYERERFDDARRILRPLVDQAPGSAAVRELLGLTEYRRGRWRAAVKQLEAFRSLTGSVEQHPVLADSYRALGRHRQVDELWEELRAASPSAELVAEGRIVTAGSLADRGDIPAAIRVLEKGRVNRNHPAEHHLRQWYALADLYERAGDIPRARELFGRVAAADPDAFDVRGRLRALR